MDSTRTALPAVEVLVSSNCPNVSLALERIRQAAASIGLAGLTPTLVQIDTASHAVDARFLGSPSVRVAGRDVEPGVEDRSDFGLQCRLYSFAGALDHAPPVEWIASSLLALGLRTTR
jgi:hypothetical protein